MTFNGQSSGMTVIAGLVAAAGLASLGMAPLSAEQAPAGTVKPWTMPRTTDGKPDLQGTWSNSTITPLERPQGVSNLVLSADDAARLEKATSDRVARLNQNSDPNRTAPPQGGDAPLAPPAMSVATTISGSTPVSGSPWWMASFAVR